MPSALNEKRIIAGGREGPAYAIRGLTEQRLITIQE